MRGNEKRFVSGGACAMLTLSALIAACSSERQYALEPVAAGSALDGRVGVSEDNLGNTMLNIDVSVPEAASLDGGKHYVAWARTAERPSLLGVLNIQGDRAKLIATTNAEQFAVLVTVEETPGPTAPSGDAVLRSGTIAVER